MRTALDFPRFLLPVLVPFLFAVPRSRRALWIFTGCGLLVAVPGLVAMHHHTLYKYIFPTLGNYVTRYGVLQTTPLHGTQQVLLGAPVRVILAAAAFAGLFSTVAAVVEMQPSRPSLSDVNWYEAGWLLIPFALAYFGLLCPRAAFNTIFDRYLIVPLAFGMIPLLRWLGEHVWRSPAQCRNAFSLAAVTLSVITIFTVAGTHDAVARFRAQTVALAELRRAGVPPTHIDGGLEYNGWTQIVTTGTVTDARVRAKESNDPCVPYQAELFPSLHPEFLLSSEPDSGGVPACLPPTISPHGFLTNSILCT